MQVPIEKLNYLRAYILTFCSLPLRSIAFPILFNIVSGNTYCCVKYMRYIISYMQIFIDKYLRMLKVALFFGK